MSHINRTQGDTKLSFATVAQTDEKTSHQLDVSALVSTNTIPQRSHHSHTRSLVSKRSYMSHGTHKSYKSFTKSTKSAGNREKPKSLKKEITLTVAE